MWRHWYKPSYWRWWWQSRASLVLKVALAVGLVALMIGLGYESSRFLPTASGAKTYTTLTHITTVREVSVRVRTVTIDHVVTTVRNERRVVPKLVRVTTRVTVPGPIRFVTRIDSRTVSIPVVSKALVTVTQPVTLTSTRPVTSTRVETRTVPVPTTSTVTATVVRTTTVPVTVTRTSSQITTVIETVTTRVP